MPGKRAKSQFSRQFFSGKDTVASPRGGVVLRVDNKETESTHLFVAVDEKAVRDQAK